MPDGAPALLRLYRRILRSAARFPSIRRAHLIDEIKAEFRANAGEADPAKRAAMRRVAAEGLAQLSAYSGLDGRAAEWQVSLAGGMEQADSEGHGQAAQGGEEGTMPLTAPGGAARR